jgi:hypothetical protein
LERDELSGAGGTFGATGNACGFLVTEPKERGIFEDVRLNERIILKWVLQKYGEKVWTGLF